MAETVGWFTGVIPWALIVPRPRYVRGLKVYFRVPEIRREINAQAFWRLVEAAGWVLWAPVWVPLLALLLIESALGRIAKACLPDFASKRSALIEQAWAKVSLEEIQRRIGDTDNG